MYPLYSCILQLCRFGIFIALFQMLINIFISLFDLLSFQVEEEVQVRYINIINKTVVIYVLITDKYKTLFVNAIV